MRSLLPVLIPVLLCLGGCAYFHDRVTDAAEIIDLGVTASSTPDFSVYADGFSVLPIGWSNLDGAFVGLADGHPGVSSAIQRSAGQIVYGTEQIAYDSRNYSNDEPQYSPEWKTGIIGLMNGPIPPDKKLFGLPIQVHLAWLGAAFNFKSVELVDFVLGFACIDITSDDIGNPRDESVLGPARPKPPIEGYEARP